MSKLNSIFPDDCYSCATEGTRIVQNQDKFIEPFIYTKEKLDCQNGYSFPLPNNPLLIHGLAEIELWGIREKTVDLIITSPPYNIGKEYENVKNLSDYLLWLKGIIFNCVRILKDGGSICWIVGDFIATDQKIPLDIWSFLYFENLNMKLQNRIVWTYDHGLHAKKRLSGRYQTILWFTKSTNYTFNLDSIRVPQKHPNKKHYRGSKKGQLSCNPLGKNPTDVWAITNVKHNHPEKTSHPAQLPSELVERLVKGLSNEGNIICDPFFGSGTVAVMARKHMRSFIGIEKEEKYIEITKQRIQKLKAEFGAVVNA